MGLYLLIFSALLPHLPALEKYLGFHSSSQNSLQFHTSVPSSQRTRVLSPKLCKHKQRLQRRSGSNRPPAPSHAAPSSPERWDGVTPGCRALGRPGTMPGAAVPGRLRSPGGSARRRGAPRSSAALLCPPATRRRQRDGEPGAAGAFREPRARMPGKVSVPRACFSGAAREGDGKRTATSGETDAKMIKMCRS